MANWIQPVTLTGELIQLEPMQPEHRDELLLAASDGDLWELWFTSVPSPESIDEYLNAALTARDQAGEMPFVVRHLDSGKIIGATRYCHTVASNKRIEIGYTWYAKSYQRSGVNTEAKFLLLKHAFESLKATAVEFRTHWFNHRSRNAIERIGAKQDGVLRKHQKMADGTYRDTVVFSIIDDEWPAVKQHLKHLQVKN